MTVPIMKSFIGIWLNMGLNPRHTINSYWDTSRSQIMPIYSHTFRRDTFKSILQSFHASDRERQPARGTVGFDPLYKFRPVLDHCNLAWKREWNLHQHISIDETLLGLNGNIH